MATALQHTARRHVAHHDEESDTPSPDATFGDTVISPRMQRVKRRRLEDPTLDTLVGEDGFGGTLPCGPWRRR